MLDCLKFIREDIEVSTLDSFIFSEVAMYAILFIKKKRQLFAVPNLQKMFGCKDFCHVKVNFIFFLSSFFFLTTDFEDNILYFINDLCFCF